MALLREDLQSPCTEEVAVFHAFSRHRSRGKKPLCCFRHSAHWPYLAAYGCDRCYHRQMTRNAMPENQGRIIKPLMRLQDANYSKIILVALPETTQFLKQRPFRKTCAVPKSNPMRG